MQKTAADAYFHTKVITTDQGDIVVMLYDGAIKFLNRALGHLAANDMAQKGIAISRALDIINELDGSLNMEQGGSISDNLHSLYIFCSKHLVMANLKKDPERIGHVIKILTGLRGAYAEILTLPEARQAARQAAANMPASPAMSARPKSGANSVAPDAPAPGAEARLRHLYARNTARHTSDANRTTETGAMDFKTAPKQA